ncbi:MAG: TrmH family RNA methyltransferase, partial [Bdellovibrionaceae bacterium]|nr:TrmH family RNA methyltransferase [Pseudobdellovibrionaceae bacterium]
GYTPTPDHTKTARSALGAEVFVPWTHHEKTADSLGHLRQMGYRLVAFETAEQALPLDHPFQPVPTALVFGNERFGLSADLLALCDEVRILPLEGVKNSLNAAVIAALAAYEWKKQWNSKP